MAKLPSWIRLEYRGISADGRGLDYDVQVRKWHPGFLLYGLRLLWAAYRRKEPPE